MNKPNFLKLSLLGLTALPVISNIEKLAEMAGCGADELIITRNTTESLDTV